MTTVTTTVNIGMDCVYYILSMLHPAEVASVNTKYAHHSRKIINTAVKKIQMWYRSRKLFGYEPYEYVTRRTLIRFYIVKYKKEWLNILPERAIWKLGLTGPYISKYLNPTTEMRIGKVRTFLNFCNDFNITREELWYYGW